MIRAIDNKPLDLSDAEYEYYGQIVDAFGAMTFQHTFEVDENESSPYYGFITLVKPSMSQSLPVGAVFFLFNVQLNQRIRKLEAALTKLESMHGK